MEAAVIADLGTAAGTLVLAVATFASVRSANRAARIAEESLLVQLRPLLVPSRLRDDSEKVGFSDQRWFMVAGGHGIAEVSDEAIYLAMALRNVGSGLAVLHGWRFYPERIFGAEVVMPAPDTFRMLTRDLYIAPGDHGFMQGAFRDPTDEEFLTARKAIEAGNAVMIDLLYGDHEGGQRMISRFGLTPHERDGEIARLAAVSRHWYVDRAAPR